MALSDAYGVDWRDLAIANGVISPYTIRPGQINPSSHKTWWQIPRPAS